jgi:iron complex outermembrane receptor protein
MKATYTTSSSISGIESLVNGEWTSNDETSNRIYMKEGIGAMYASANTRINESTNLVIGARYEFAHTNMDNPKTGENIVDRKLGTLFPNIYFSKKLSGKSELQLSYTKRISRPAYNDLASYVGYADPTAVYTGNPFLKPTITHNFKVGYNYKTYSFSILFSRDNNAIVRYQLTQSPSADILFISPQNLNWQNNISLQANLPFSINNWWNMNFNLVGRFTRFKLDYTLHPLEKSYFAYSLNFSQNFKLPGNFSAELSGWYNSYSYDGTKKVDGFGTLNIGIKKELKNNGGSFQLSVSDISRTQIYRIHYGTLTEEAFSIKSYVIVTTESAKSPIIKLSYTRSFGSNNLRSQKNQGNVSEEERERVRKD